ncbi:MAG: DNA gyrase modulator, partial [Myxococcota bacterium]
MPAIHATALGGSGLPRTGVQGISPAVLDPALALELGYSAIEEALRLKASFADVRLEASLDEELTVSGGRYGGADLRSGRGLGVRVLVDGAWGYAAVDEPNRHDIAVTVKRAIELARAAAILQERPVSLIGTEPQRGVFRTPIRRDPFE